MLARRQAERSYSWSWPPTEPGSTWQMTCADIWHCRRSRALTCYCGRGAAKATVKGLSEACALALPKASTQLWPARPTRQQALSRWDSDCGPAWWLCLLALASKPCRAWTTQVAARSTKANSVAALHKCPSPDCLRLQLVSQAAQFSLRPLQPYSVINVCPRAAGAGAACLIKKLSSKSPDH